MAIQANEFTFKTTDSGYIIYLNNAPYMIQTGFIPVPGKTIAESAQNHINKIVTDSEAAEKAAQEPTIPDRVTACEAAIIDLMKG